MCGILLREDQESPGMYEYVWVSGGPLSKSLIGKVWKVYKRHDAFYMDRPKDLILSQTLLVFCWIKQDGLSLKAGTKKSGWLLGSSRARPLWILIVVDIIPWHPTTEFHKNKQANSCGRNHLPCSPSSINRVLNSNLEAFGFNRPPMEDSGNFDQD